MAGGHGRWKKRRAAAPSDDAAARNSFLAALEAQRAKARAEGAAKPVETAAVAAPAASIPGFYYDNTKRRYFRSSPATEKRQRVAILNAQHQQQLQAKAEALNAPNRREKASKSHNWVTYLSRRQSDFQWSARARDRRALMPQFLSGSLASQVVEAQNVQNNGRLTALALHQTDSSFVAMSSSGGDLDILETTMQPPKAGTALPLLQAAPMVTHRINAVITSLEWRPVQEMDLLVTHIGNPQRGNRSKQGAVTFMRLHEFSRTHRTEWAFVDPWIAKWDPTNSSKFSVGSGGKSSAAYVDVVGSPNTAQHAPRGTIKSDVHAQSFYSTGQVVINGTKSGAIWGWDLRSPQRAFEMEVDTSRNQPASSVVDIHVLNDHRRAVVQRSNGELRLMDLRTFKPVVEFMPGVHNQYRSSMRCSVDSSETIVVAGDMLHPRTVNSYDLQNGRKINSLEVTSNSMSTETRSAIVEQVLLKPSSNNSRYADTPEIWALTRDDLYICSRRSDSVSD